MAHIFLYVYYFLIGRQIKALTFSKGFDMITHSHKKLVQCYLKWKLMRVVSMA